VSTHRRALIDSFLKVLGSPYQYGTVSQSEEVQIVGGANSSCWPPVDDECVLVLRVVVLLSTRHYSSIFLWLHDIPPAAILSKGNELAYYRQASHDVQMRCHHY
jgi:hypothetical protein